MGIVLPEGIFNNPSLAYVREFCEDRARVLAVVSLPQETFYSSGASVKASLLFLRKFTEEEAADFAAKRDAAKAEVEAKYAPKSRRKRPACKRKSRRPRPARTRDAARRPSASLPTTWPRWKKPRPAKPGHCLKERFDYPIFLYEAEKVGITATGEPDANELYPNDRHAGGHEAGRHLP